MRGAAGTFCLKSESTKRLHEYTPYNRAFNKDMPAPLKMRDEMRKTVM